MYRYALYTQCGNMNTSFCRWDVLCVLIVIGCLSCLRHVAMQLIDINDVQIVLVANGDNFSDCFCVGELQNTSPSLSNRSVGCGRTAVTF